MSLETIFLLIFSFSIMLFTNYVFSLVSAMLVLVGPKCRSKTTRKAIFITHTRRYSIKNEKPRA